MGSLREFEIGCVVKAAIYLIKLKCLTCSSFAEAYGNDGARGRSSHSKSPARLPYVSNSYSSYDCHSQSMGAYRTDGWDSERRGSDMQSGRNFDHSSVPLTLEELELEYKREAMELGRIRDKEEDEENYKHREALREMRESYMKQLAVLRGTHAKQWEEFLQLDAQRRQQRAHQQISTPGFGGYKQTSYPEYDNSVGNPHYVGGAGIPVDSRGRYPNPMDNYTSSRPHDTYSDFQRQRREDYAKAYNRY